MSECLHQSTPAELVGSFLTLTWPARCRSASFPPGLSLKRRNRDFPGRCPPEAACAVRGSSTPVLGGRRLTHWASVALPQEERGICPAG